MKFNPPIYTVLHKGTPIYLHDTRKILTRDIVVKVIYWRMHDNCLECEYTLNNTNRYWLEMGMESASTELRQQFQEYCGK